MNIEEKARQIAMKYVYGDHDALTDEQEVQDMTKDIVSLVTGTRAENNVALDIVIWRCIHDVRIYGDKVFTRGNEYPEKIGYELTVVDDEDDDHCIGQYEGYFIAI